MGKAQSKGRIAVIGSGISGLMAAYILAKSRPVVLYERDDRLGGHAHTHKVEVGGQLVNVDTGFIVHNDRTYPNLCRLFDELKISTQPTDMSMSVRRDVRGIEYAGGKGLAGLFPTLGHVLNRQHLRLLREIPGFHRAARATLDQLTKAPHSATCASESLADFVARTQITPSLKENFLIPLVSAVWSCDPSVAMDYPASYLFQFLEHHGMLSVFHSPQWRTVVGGSARYVEKVAACLEEVRVGRKVIGVERTPEGINVTDASGESENYEAAVIATHPHQARDLLTDASRKEREILGSLPYTPHKALLHTDEKLLPRVERARASWNYWEPGKSGNNQELVVTYDLSRLMRLGRVGGHRLLVTLGGEECVDPRSVLKEIHYEHPLYTVDSVAAQKSLTELGSDTLAFAGAYHGWGFHEDGAVSGRRAAERLGFSWAH